MDSRSHIRAQAQSLAKSIREHGVRPTKQRVAIAAILFDGKDKHMTAEEISTAFADQRDVCTATVYNTLHQFTEAGLLREVVVGPGSFLFDTNLKPHDHMLHEGTGELTDIPSVPAVVPDPPENSILKRVDVIVRVRKLIPA